MAYKLKELDFKLREYPNVRNNMLKHSVFTNFLDMATEEQLDFCENFFSDEVSILFNDSNAGTGKTFCSVACAYADYLNHGKGITFVMSPVAEILGSRPGSQAEKELDYFSGLHDSLLDLNLYPEQVVKNLLELDDNISKEKLGEAFVTQTTHVFLRGSNISNCTLIVSESQNFTKSELKKVLTRVHDSTTVIVEGHRMQIDLKNEDKSGFVPYQEHFKKFDRASFHTFSRNFRGKLAQFADEYSW